MFNWTKFSMAACVAAGVFYLAFFLVAPFVSGLIPDSDWKGLLDLIVYVGIAWLGGIGVPLTILFLGFIWGCRD